MSSKYTYYNTLLKNTRHNLEVEASAWLILVPTKLSSAKFHIKSSSDWIDGTRGSEVLLSDGLLTVNPRYQIVSYWMTKIQRKIEVEEGRITLDGDM